MDKVESAPLKSNLSENKKMTGIELECLIKEHIVCFHNMIQEIGHIHINDKGKRRGNIGQRPWVCALIQLREGWEKGSILMMTLDEVSKQVAILRLF